MKISLQLPQLRRDQWNIVKHKAKIKVLAMGRRWGKSVLGQCVAIPTAMSGARVAWCVPNYRNGRPLWRLIVRALGPLKKAKLCRIDNSERIVEFPRTGGFLALYSMDNPDSIRGENFHLIIIDEAAMISEDAWLNCIQPTLADNDGDCILISTPKGRNWFWKEWTQAKAHMEQCEKTGATPRFAAFTATSRDNPNPNIQRAFDLAKERVPERTYLQEWCAQFLEDGGTVFRFVARVAKALKRDPYAGAFVMGVDWGKNNDYTVLMVMDVNTGKIVDWDRFNTIGWSLQRGRLVTMFNRWQPDLILAEENSIGEPNIELLMQEGLPILGFNTNGKTKGPLIESYSLSIERQEIETPAEQLYTNELEAYEGEKNPKTGRMTYGAPEGGHDDTVIAGALADWARLHYHELLSLLEGERSEEIPEDEYAVHISNY